MFDECGDDIAGLIIEPVVGNANCLPPREGYLQHLRELCTRHGALLIFDEVMTGFRVALGGAQARYGVTPDLTTFGKIIGGGMPVGAYGGRRDLMQQIAPERPDLPGRHAQRQSGGDGGGPGDARADPGAGLPRRARSAARTRCATASKRPRAMPACAFTTNRVGGCSGCSSATEQVDTYAQAIACDTAAFNRFFHAMLERGVYLAPSAFEAGFMSSAHGDAEIAHTHRRRARGVPHRQGLTR